MGECTERDTPISWDSAVESVLSERIYKILLKWSRFALEQYKPWPNRERCGHFFGGAYWYGSETASTTMVLAIVSKFGSYDEKVAGVPHDELMDKAVQGIRYLCYTHDTGPEDCVRVTSNNRANSGTKWGGKGAPYFQATQTGVSVNSLGIAAMLLWDQLDLETRELVYTVTTYYADRWSPLDPLNGVYVNTQCEENAWTAAGISAAAYLFPNDPRAVGWKAAVAKWALGSVGNYKDQIELGPQATITFHPDWTAENHRFVHPSYMAAGINLRSPITLLAMLQGDEVLDEATRHNWELYDQTLLAWGQFDGIPIPIQGQSWWYNRQHEALQYHTVMYSLLGHPHAKTMARASLSMIEKLQDSNTRGCLLEEKGEQCIVMEKDDQTAKDFEHQSAKHTALAYLHCLFGNKAVKQKEKLRTTQTEPWTGVAEYPYGGFIVHGTGRAFSSFSWRNHVMALTLPERGLWDATPLFTSYTGTLQVEDTAKSSGIIDDELVIESYNQRIVPYKDGFGAIVRLERANGLLNQEVAFISLPDSCSVYVEMLKANRSCRLSEAYTGLIGIRNENYAQLGEIARGTKTVYYEGGSMVFEGYYGRTPDNSCELGGQEWVNVDGRLGYIIFGSAGVKYINRHEYPKWKGVEDLLVLNCREEHSLDSQQKLPLFVACTLPNQDEVQTADTSKLIFLWNSKHPKTVMLEMEQALVYVNFLDHEIVAEGSIQTVNRDNPSRSIFDGSTFIEKGDYRWKGELPMRQSGYFPRRATLDLEKDSETNLFIQAAAGQLTITNQGKDRIELQIRLRNALESSKLSIDAMQTIIL